MEDPRDHCREAYRNAQYRLGKLGRLRKLTGDQEDR